MEVVIGNKIMNLWNWQVGYFSIAQNGVFSVTVDIGSSFVRTICKYDFLTF